VDDADAIVVIGVCDAPEHHRCPGSRGLPLCRRGPECDIS
jgi:hypothetical protein